MNKYSLPEIKIVEFEFSANIASINDWLTSNGNAELADAGLTTAMVNSL